MDKKEFAMFASALRTYYPKENLLPNNQAIELWYQELCDIPYDVAQASLRKWVVNNKWSPSIFEIREMSITVSMGDIPAWDEGWEQVMKAIRTYGLYNADKAMQELDPISRQCVERLGFRNICMSENIAADRANFRIIFESLIERKKKDSLLPQPLKEAILAIQQQNGTTAEGFKLLSEN